MAVCWAVEERRRRDYCWALAVCCRARAGVQGVQGVQGMEAEEAVWRGLFGEAGGVQPGVPLELEQASTTRTMLLINAATKLPAKQQCD